MASLRVIDIKRLAIRRLERVSDGKERLEHAASVLYALAGETLESSDSSSVLYNALVDAAVALKCAAVTAAPLTTVPFHALRARIVDA